MVRRCTAWVGVLALAAYSTVASAEPPASSAAVGSATTIRVNGDSSDAILGDPDKGSNGFINVGRDRVGNTTALDFSYVMPTSDPNTIILFQGAGEIPNSAFTTTNTTAALKLVTPFPVIRCEINLETGDFGCADGDPIAFDLRWVVNGVATVQEHVSRLETLGPLTVRATGWYDQRTAIVNGTWNGNSAFNNSGNLLDTRGMTVLREITMQTR